MLHTVKVADLIDEKGEKVIGKNDLHVIFRDDFDARRDWSAAKELLKKAVSSKPADVGVLRPRVACRGSCRS